MKSTAAVAKTEDRLTKVLELVLAGASEADIVAKVADYGITKKELPGYLKRVQTELQKAAQTNRQQAYAMAVARCNRLFAASLRIQDYKTALAVLKELHRLQGL